MKIIFGVRKGVRGLYKAPPAQRDARCMCPKLRRGERYGVAGLFLIKEGRRGSRFGDVPYTVEAP